MNRVYAVTVALVAGLGLSGCTQATEPEPVAADPAVIDHRGLPDIPFGADRAELERRLGLTEAPGACAPRLPDRPEVSPVFDDRDRLVLMWANPPLQTPDGIMVGTPVETVRDTYPDAQRLPAPPGTQRFDGLLVPVDDRAYLFLHDGTEVQKVIVGYADYVRLLFDEGFGTC
jgi:hypothetical protein